MSEIIDRTDREFGLRVSFHIREDVDPSDPELFEMVREEAECRFGGVVRSVKFVNVERVGGAWVATYSVAFAEAVSS